MDDPFDMAAYWDARAREDALRYADDGARGAADFWRRGERAVDQLLRELDVELRPGDEVLDLGCGPGRMTRALAGQVRRVVALDVSPEMLRLAQEWNAGLRNVEWVLGDGSTLAPLPDASLDVAIAVRVFRHLPDAHLTLGYVSELGRVLRPGGWAAFQVSTDPSAHEPERGAPEPLRDPRWLGSALPLEALQPAAIAGGLELVRIEGTRSPRSLVLARRERR